MIAQPLSGGSGERGKGRAVRAGDRVEARAPGKVNLYLGCGGRLPDGYHLLDTVFLAVDVEERGAATLLGEERVPVGAEASAGGVLPAWLEVSFSGQGSEQLAVDGTNLVVRAAVALATHLGYALPTRVEVEKRVPVAAGMAGGSADAALTLAALNELWGADVPPAALLDLARGLGADVPFGLVGGLAHAGARGDEPVALAPLPGPPQLHLAFFASPLGLSTPAVFGEFDRGNEVGEVGEGGRPGEGDAAAGELNGVATRVDDAAAEAGHGLPAAPHPAAATPQVVPTAPRPAPAALLEAARAGDAATLAGLIANDLQGPALRLRPELERTIAAAHEAGALRAFVSGSGPTIAALCGSREDAERVASAVTSALGEAELGYPLRAVVASGPVAGASVAITSRGPERGASDLGPAAPAGQISAPAAPAPAARTRIGEEK